MDLTSYLLGKKNGGGGPTPTYEQKNVTITSNGTTNVTPSSGYDALSKVVVETNVPQGLVYETGVYVPEEDTQELRIEFGLQHTGYPDFFYISDAGNENDPADTNVVLAWEFIYNKKMTDNIYSQGTQRVNIFYGYIIEQLKHATNVGSTSNIINSLMYDHGTPAGTYPKSYCDYYFESNFNGILPKVISSSTTDPTQVFKEGRTYKWIAIWR